MRKASLRQALAVVLSFVVRFTKPEQAVFSPGYIVILAWGPSAGVGLAVNASYRYALLLLVYFGRPGIPPPALSHGASAHALFH